MAHDKKIALVAHDNKKWDLAPWAKFNRDFLSPLQISSPLMDGECDRLVPDCEAYRHRKIAGRAAAAPPALIPPDMAK